MIIYSKGNLLESNAEALVNTVNCVGVMGKGIALQFKQAYPENFKAYQKVCRAKELVPGRMFIFSTRSLVKPKFIINFPTKDHWRSKSRMKDIEEGLISLVNEIKRLNIKSIAIPPLGCGNGGLNWDDVRPEIENTLSQLPDLTVFLYGPSGGPAPEKIKIGSEAPNMTKARALFISLMKEYNIPGYSLSLLEIQKLAYFLQEAGEKLQLRFVKHFYGPYADNLNHVLQRLDGHYIRGYGDRNKEAQIVLLPKAKEADEFLRDETESHERLQEVKQIIRGFETPYGMEILATVHWVIKENPELAYKPEEIVENIHNWNPRKKRVFKENHIYKAWKHFKDLGILMRFEEYRIR